MHLFTHKPLVTPLVLLVVLVTAGTLTLTSGLTATGTPAAAPTSVAVPAAQRTVAHTSQGEVTTRIRGTTANDRRVTGSFVPLRFVNRNGKLKVRGLLQGVVHNRDGSTRTFGVMRSLRVTSINGQATDSSATGTRQRPACDVLHLVLGPLDLDLLGLQVHLDRVVLDIVAQPGPGNLLGNLLCAVAGLLDDGLGGVLGRVTRLLNRILGRLGLGL